MEAALLTLDVLLIILLLRNVLRVEKTGNPAALGLFRYPVAKPGASNPAKTTEQVTRA